MYCRVDLVTDVMGTVVVVRERLFTAGSQLVSRCHFCLPADAVACVVWTVSMCVRRLSASTSETSLRFVMRLADWAASSAADTVYDACPLKMRFQPNLFCHGFGQSFHLTGSVFSMICGKCWSFIRKVEDKGM